MLLQGSNIALVIIKMDSSFFKIKSSIKELLFQFEYLFLEIMIDSLNCFFKTSVSLEFSPIKTKLFPKVGLNLIIR